MRLPASYKLSSMVFTPLQMGSGMMPSFDWGSMWLFMVLPSVVVGSIIVVIVSLFLRRERTGPSNIAVNHTSSTSAASLDQQSRTQEGRSENIALGNVFRSLSPTLMDDEKRVVDELARAGGEVLQSDLPRMTDFSKSTVSKVIHSLEVRGIVVREKHKWTYWCKINPRLVERVQRGEIASLESQTHDRPSLEPSSS